MLVLRASRQTSGVGVVFCLNVFDTGRNDTVLGGSLCLRFEFALWIPSILAYRTVSHALETCVRSALVAQPVIRLAGFTVVLVVFCFHVVAC